MRGHCVAQYRSILLVNFLPAYWTWTNFTWTTVTLVTSSCIEHAFFFEFRVSSSEARSSSSRTKLQKFITNFVVVGVVGNVDYVKLLITCGHAPSALCYWTLSPSILRRTRFITFCDCSLTAVLTCGMYGWWYQDVFHTEICWDCQQRFCIALRCRKPTNGRIDQILCFRSSRF